MCMAVPGKVIKIENDIATIDYNGEIREASTVLNNCNVGDWVIVSAKFVMKIIPEQEALKTIAVWDEADGK